MTGTSDTPPAALSELLGISYRRVSTEEQGKEGVSLDAQEARIVAAGAARNVRLVEDFVDAGNSGETMRRPGLQAALAALRSGRASVLVVAKLDRLTRRMLHSEQLLEQYFGPEASFTLISAEQAFDAKTADGVMFVQMLMLFAERELRMIRERTRGALEHKRAAGRVSGALPLGFDRDGDKLVPNIEEAATLELARQMQAAGESFGAIARALTERGRPSKRGGKWTAWTVSKLLKRSAMPALP